MEYPECFSDMGHKIYCLGYDPAADGMSDEQRSEAVRREAIACHACPVFDPCWKISLNSGVHGSELNVAERLTGIESALGGVGPDSTGFGRLH